MRIPVELLIMILEQMRPMGLVRMITVSRKVRDLLDCATSTGRGIWKTVREREGLPDPATIGMSDKRLLLCVHTRGCDRCHSHPRIRTPRWEFGGVKLCHDCFDNETVRDYILGDGAEFEGLPYMTTDGTCYGRHFSYRSYLWSHIRNKELFTGDLTQAYFDFKYAMDDYMSKRRQTIESVREERRTAINAYLAPRFTTTAWKNCAQYLNACRRPVPLTEHAARRLYLKLREVFRLAPDSEVTYPNIWNTWNVQGLQLARSLK